MTPRVMGWLRLDRALVCLELDCGAIFDASFHDCPACGSSGFMPLAAWLDRERGPSGPLRLEGAGLTLAAVGRPTSGCAGVGE